MKILHIIMISRMDHTFCIKIWDVKPVTLTHMTGCLETIVESVIVSANGK